MVKKNPVVCPKTQFYSQKKAKKRLSKDHLPTVIAEFAKKIVDQY